MFKDILDNSNLTCYKLAKLSQVSYTAINELYRGERSLMDCSLAIARKIAIALNLSLEELCELAEKREEIPLSLYPCFWDTDPKSLKVEENKTYIITRLLDKGGYDGLAFLKKAYTYEEMKNVARNSRNFTPKIASFLQNVYHLKKEEMKYYTMNVKDWRKPS